MDITDTTLVPQLKKRLHFDGTLTITQQTTLLQIVDRACQRPVFLRYVVVGPGGSGKTYLAKTWVQLVDRWHKSGVFHGDESMIEAFRYLDCNASDRSAKPYRALAGDLIKQLQGHCETEGFTHDRMYAELASVLKAIDQLVLFIDYPDHGASIDEATKFVEDLTTLGKEYNNLILIPMVREGSDALTSLDTPDTDEIIPLPGPTLADIKRQTYILCESYERSIEEPTAQFVAAFLVRTRQTLPFIRKLIERAATLTPPDEYFPELTPAIIQTTLNQLAVNPALQPIVDEYPLNLVIQSYAAIWNQGPHPDGTPCPVSVSRLYQMFVHLTTDRGLTPLPSHAFEAAVGTLVQRNLVTRPDPFTVSLHPTLCYADTKAAILAWDPFAALNAPHKKVRGVYATKTETIQHIKKPNQIAALKAIVTLLAQHKSLEPLTSKQIYSRYLDFCAELGGKSYTANNFISVVLPSLKHRRLITTEVVTTDKGWETWVSDTGLTAEEVQAVHDRYQAILAERTTVRNKIDPAPALQPDSPTPEPEEPQPKPTGPSSLLHDAYSRVTSPNGIGGDGLDFSGGTSVSDQVPFISAQRSHEMEEEPAVCRGGIDVVRDRDEPDIPLLQVVDNRKQVPLSRWEAMFWVGEETRVLDAGLTAEEVQAVHERYQTILAERNRPSI